MSKYNLKDLLIEGMSDQEFSDAQEADRLGKNPERDKIAKIRAMLAKEKPMKENYQMDGETYERIDGLINNNLKGKFISAFEDLHNDMVEAGDEFDKDDVLDYLTIQIDKTLREGYSNQDGDKDDSPPEKETEKMRYKEGVQPGDIEDDAAEKESDKMRKIKEGDAAEAETQKMRKIKEGDAAEAETQKMRKIKEENAEKETQMMRKIKEADYAEDETQDMRKINEADSKKIDSIIEYVADYNETDISDIIGQLRNDISQPEEDRSDVVRAMLRQMYKFTEPEMVSTYMDDLGQDIAVYEAMGPKHADGTPKSNDEMTDDEREQYYLDSDTIDLDEKSSRKYYSENKRTDAEEEGYKDGMRDEKDDLDENARTDAEEEGYKDGMKDAKRDMDENKRTDAEAKTQKRRKIKEENIEDKKLKEHFQRFLKDYQ